MKQVLTPDHLVAAMKHADSVTILTGAGVSVASGIAPFRRSNDSLWERHVTEIATKQFFLEEPVKSWDWYLKRFEGILDKLPNPAHEALAHLEYWYQTRHREFTLVTQNIDTLHRKAGNHSLIEIHGRADMCRCINPRCEKSAPSGLIPSHEIDFETFMRMPSVETLPKCPLCSHLVRPHILWFDECYDEHVNYQYERALSTFQEADVLLFIGTSFSVGITETALYLAESGGADMWMIDPAPLCVSANMNTLTGKSEELLPQIIKALY